VAALDTLPWIQKNRRIFFLGSWLAATIGGQSDREALTIIDAWLAAHPSLAPDLRQKVLQSRDELERTVRGRERFAADGGRGVGRPLFDRTETGDADASRISSVIPTFSRGANMQSCDSGGTFVSDHPRCRAR
jgi:hypothetical protein